MGADDMEDRTPAPEGEAWRTVPVEPTADMRRAFEDARPDTAVQDDEGGWTAPYTEWFRARYTAMLAASPVVPVGVSREELADKVYRILRHSDRRPSPDHGLIPPMDTGVSLAIADAVLAALRPTDTGEDA
jgi:hypothetical protein